jgi:hypothetical protein
MTSSTGVTKILPSPMWPVRATRHERLDHVLDHLVLDDDLNPDLGDEVHDVGGAAVDLFLAAGSSEAFDFGNGHSLHSDLAQAVLDVIELERFDDGFDLFHDAPAGKSRRPCAVSSILFVEEARLKTSVERFPTYFAPANFGKGAH